MEPCGMDVVTTKVPRRKEPINLITGVFLKSVFFLSNDLSKSVIVGIYKNRGCSLGLVFAGRHGPVYWSNDTFNNFFIHFNEISLAAENNKRIYKKLDTGEDIKVQSIFGNTHVFLYDGEHTLSLTAPEWMQFVNTLPCITRNLRELFMCEHLIRDYILELMMLNDDSYLPPPLGFPLYLSDRLYDEVQYYKRWPNGGC